MSRDESTLVKTEKDVLDPEEIIDLTKRVNFDLVSEEKWQKFLVGEGLVAYVKLQGKLIGFARVNHNGVTGMIYDMCIDPDAQGDGLGGMIVRSLINQSKDIGLQSLGLDAWKGDQRLIQFYERHGFKRIDKEGSPKNYMELTL